VYWGVFVGVYWGVFTGVFTGVFAGVFTGVFMRVFSTSRKSVFLQQGHPKLWFRIIMSIIWEQCGFKKRVD
jgi:H+/Cl- antiporter ClcA